MRAKLIDLLTPSTTIAELEAIPMKGGRFRPYLRVKQKDADMDPCQVDGRLRNGAHVPLLLCTENERGRSSEGVKKRNQRPRKQKSDPQAPAQQQRERRPPRPFYHEAAWGAKPKLA